MKNKLLFLYGTLLFIACHQRPDNVMVQEFPCVKELKHEEINVMPPVYSPMGFVLLDSAAIVVESNGEVYFKIFKRPSFQQLNPFVRRGSGMGEEFFVDPFIQPLSRNRFLYRNMTGVKIVEYQPLHENVEVTNDIKFPIEMSGVFHVFQLGDRLIGVDNDTPTKREFRMYNQQTEEVVDFGHNYPDVGRFIEDRYKIQLFAKVVTVNPDGNRFACVYDKFPILRIYSDEGELMCEARFDNRQSFPDALVKDNPTLQEVSDIVQNYRMIRSTSRYIYALYIGKRADGLSLGLNDLSNIIHVWDWDGKAVAQYLLDRNIFTFDVSEDDGTLFACSLENPDGIYRYDLTK